MSDDTTNAAGITSPLSGFLPCCAHEWITCQHDPANQSCLHCFQSRPTPQAKPVGRPKKHPVVKAFERAAKDIDALSLLDRRRVLMALMALFPEATK